MELRELDVGELRTRPGCQREAVARHLEGIARGGVGLAETARGEHDRGGTDRPDVQDLLRRLSDPTGEKPDRSPVLSEQGVDGDGLFEDLDVRVQHRAQQRAVDLGSGGVAAGVDDAPMRMAPFETELALVESGPELRQHPDGPRCGADQRGDR